MIPYRPGLAAVTAASLALGAAVGLAAPGTASPSAPAAEVLLPDVPGLDGPARLSPDLAAILGTDVLDPATLPARTSLPRRAAGEPATVGTTRLWPAADMRGEAPTYSLRPFTLRAMSATAEVWVAAGPEGTRFPPGDCRNERPDEVDISDAQAAALAKEFHSVIQARMTKAFSEPVARDGTRTVPGIPAAGLDFSGSGERTVVLADNIRDSGYDKVGEPGFSGFFTPLFNTLTDRNVITVDSYDWKHRTGANPPDEPTDDLCTSRTSRPRFIESTLAHEWYHLLSADRDNLEPLWIEEGMAQYAMSVVGYPKTRRTVAQPHAERELLCFQGFGTTKGPSNSHPVPCGGPQNSLTRWEDEGGGHNLLADYGNAWSFMLFLADRYGPGVMRTLHRDRGSQGMLSVQLHTETPVTALLHDFRLMNLLDRLADTKGAQVRGIAAGRVRTAGLSAALDLANPASHAAPGAGPNGGDYLDLGPGRTLRSLAFTGEVTQGDDADAALDAVFEPLGIPLGLYREPGRWTVDLVAIDRGRARALVKSYVGPTLALDAAKLAAFAGYPQVVAVVGYDRVFGRNDGPGGYTLTVNDERRAGG